MLTRTKTLGILPVGLLEVKAHIRVDHSYDDEYLLTLIQAANGFVEEYLGRSLLTQRWLLTWDKGRDDPSHLSTAEDDACSIPLPYPPLRTILSVNRLMVDGNKQPIRRHFLEMNHTVPRLVFARVPEPVEIEFETGYGDRSPDIPSVIRQAILMCVADYYEYRDSKTMPRNSIIREMLDAYRAVRMP